MWLAMGPSSIHTPSCLRSADWQFQVCSAGQMGSQVGQAEGRSGKVSENSLCPKRFPCLTCQFHLKSHHEASLKSLVKCCPLQKLLTMQLSLESIPLSKGWKLLEAKTVISCDPGPIRPVKWAAPLYLPPPRSRVFPLAPQTSPGPPALRF